MALHSEDLLDLDGCLGGEMMRAVPPWEVLDTLGARICALGETLPTRLYRRVADTIWVARSARVAESACLAGPCIIGEGAEIRHCAYIRGTALIGKGCVIGNSTEVKNAILFDGASAPHFNYIGDSILGCGVHLGAGVILSNLRSDGSAVVVRIDPPVDTGRRKLGAVIGDGCEIGCHAVLNPGVILGRGCRVYPLTSVTGAWAANSHIGGRTT